MLNELLANSSLWEIFYYGVSLLGVFNAILAIFFVRTAPGAIVWAVALTVFPLITLPFFWAFGPRRFYSYQRKIAEAHRSYAAEVPDHRLRSVTEARTLLPAELSDDQRFFEAIAESPLSKGNEITLFTTGNEYFERLFSSIERAERYVLLQYYILRSDAVGEELAHLLKARARAGVRVRLLYDQIGSFALSPFYANSLRRAGVHIHPFKTNKGLRNPFLLNFRNHRKIAICDGEVGFLGGSNIGLEYRSETARYGVWRDTDMEIRGPALYGLQQAFERDWFWATEEVLTDLNWEFPHFEDDITALPISTGPVSQVEEASLLFMNLFSLANERIWLASPYFVPDEGLLKSLELAALRGIDVRLLLPSVWDHPLVSLATDYYAAQAAEVGIRVFHYSPGFLHQKVALIDREVALVGTKNLDNRSLRINFETSLLTFGPKFAARVEEMLLKDFDWSIELEKEHFESQSPLLKLGQRFARLFSPIL